MDASGAPAPMLTTTTVAPGRELSARAAEHLRFNPGEARPEVGLEGGEACAEAAASKPVTGSVSTEEQSAVGLSPIKPAAAPGSSRSAVAPSMASMRLHTCDGARRTAQAAPGRGGGGVGAGWGGGL